MGGDPVSSSGESEYRSAWSNGVTAKVQDVVFFIRQMNSAVASAVRFTSRPLGRPFLMSMTGFDGAIIHDVLACGRPAGTGPDGDKMRVGEGCKRSPSGRRGASSVAAAEMERAGLPAILSAVALAKVEAPSDGGGLRRFPNAVPRSCSCGNTGPPVLRREVFHRGDDHGASDIALRAE